MKKILSAAFMLIAVLAATAQAPNDVVTKYNEAGAKFQANDFASAITLFEEVVAMGEAAEEDAAATAVADARKRLPQLYVRHALALAGAKKFGEALTFLDKAVASGDTVWAGNAKKVQPQVYNALAGEAWNAEDWAKSAEYYGKAHELTPGDKKVTTQLAESYGKLKEYDKSYAVFRELIAGGGAEETAWKSRLAFYMLLQASEVNDKEPARAVEILAEAVELDNNPQAWMLLLQSADAARAYNKVIEYGERAATAQTNDVQKSNAYSLLGVAYEKAGDKTKAIEVYRKVTAGPNAAGAKAQVTALQAQ